ncbi:MAG TPA: S1/P1 nuclease [Pseudolabrys sp.]|nr:S1/P1 nuclease [Pseudolabrys sp.]
MTRHRGIAFVFAGLIAIAAAPEQSLAWGVDGHKIVALVAQQFLDPAVKKKVDALLKSDKDKLTPTDIANRAVWADKYRDSDRNGAKVRYNATRQWHFVDIELNAPDYDKACFGHPALPAGTVASKGPAADCVADKILQFQAELKDPKTSKAEQLLAFKFLLHFVGDIHQPLHDADNNDEGANKVFVIFGKHTVAEKLHAYWDDVLPESLGKDVDQVAAMLADKFKDKKTAWMTGTPKDWANESFALARDVAYKVPSKTTVDKDKVKCFVLDQAYDDKSRPVVSEQLAKGGMRLAMILNDALK